MKKLKILFVSLNTKAGFDYIDSNFAQNLKNKINFTFCCVLDQYYGVAGFHSYSKEYKKDKIFRNLQTVWIGYQEELKLEILNHDVIIFSPIHGSKEYFDYASKKGKKVIILDSRFNYDISPNIKANLVLIKGERSKKILFMHSQKYLKNSNILIGSCLQSEMMKKKFLLSKKEFFKKYNIKKKNFILFLPTGPQYHKNQYKKLYKNICDLILKNNFHLILKLHPTELNKKKKTIYKKVENSSSILKKNKNLSLCDQTDFYSAITHAKKIISIHTTAYVEVNMMHKPITFVNRLSFFGLKDNLFYKKREKIGIHKLINNKIINNKIISNMDKEKGFLYFGQDILFESLNKIIKQSPQKINNKLKYKIIKNNNLYVKDYKKDVIKKISNQIFNYLEKIKIKSNSNFILDKIILKIVIIFKKILTLNV